MALEYSLYIQAEVSLKETMQLISKKLQLEAEIEESKKGQLFTNFVNGFKMMAISKDPQSIFPSFVEDLDFSPNQLVIFRLDKFADIVELRKLIIKTTIDLAREYEFKLLLVYLGEIVIFYKIGDQYVLNSDVFYSDEAFFSDLSIAFEVKEFEIE